MNQFLHILRKDVRHLWKEILISWCLLGLFVWRCIPRSQGEFTTMAFLQVSQELVALLLTLSWWTLIIRLVQDESLVGHRQFWVTRPYRWPELLVEKIVFILAFVSVPLLIAQTLILRLNGFAALPYWADLIRMQASLLVASALPVFLLSVLTATFVQVILVGLAVVLYGVVQSALIAQIPNSSMQHASSVLDLLSGAIVVGVVAAVILVQYARRRILLSCGLVLCAALLLALFDLVTPYERLIAKEFPRVTPPRVPLEISIDTARPPQSVFPNSGRTMKEGKKTRITIPILASSGDPNEIVALSGIRVRLNVPDGKSWRSNWLPTGGIVVVPNSQEQFTFDVPTDLYHSLKDTPVRLDVELASASYRRLQVWKVIVDASEFYAPRLGVCAAASFPTDMFRCRAPIRGSWLMLGMVTSSESTCSRSEKAPSTEITGYFTSLREDGVHSLLNPVVEETVGFSIYGVRQSEETWKLHPRICPGTPIHFSALTRVGRESSFHSFEGVKLAEYADQRGLIGGAGGFAVMLP